MNRAVPKDSRLEIKFVANESEVDRLTHWLRLHPGGFTSPFPARWINNIYFDTYDYSAFRQNLSGASERSKLRYRWYGYEICPTEGTLELKCKRNYFGWKLRFLVQTHPFSVGDHWREFLTKLISQLPKQAQLYLVANPQPTILTRYLRHYYVTNDQKVRATIDTQQSAYDQRYKPYLNTKHQANIPRTMVLELKFSRQNRDYAASLIQGLPIRVSRNSKYVIGLRSAHGF
jgi:hypothetical protein